MISQECVGETRKAMNNTQTIIKKLLYLTAIYISEEWYQNKNGHKKHPQDTNKSLQ